MGALPSHIQSDDRWSANRAPGVVTAGTAHHELASGVRRAARQVLVRCPLSGAHPVSERSAGSSGLPVAAVDLRDEGRTPGQSLV